jgi:hypothetical protein
VMGYAQNGFTFNCNRDTITNCSQTCITLKARVPNIKAGSGSYKVVNNSATGCFNPPVPPDLPGLPTNLTIDDKYSDSIDLPFTFPFWGTPYSKAIISANGVISFDIAEALQTTHYGIIESGTGLGAGTGTPADLPNTRYDRALIMGVYSDIDPSENTSPTQQTKYEVLGTAPHRKWVVSYYKVPMFSTTCSNQIENTYQMVLYEGLGIIEVFVHSKEICPTWNQGRGMIGLQDYDRLNGIMAPGRAASDAPWGGNNMNESWRFIPSSGASLLKRVELYDLAGTLVAVGTTTDLGDGNLEATFNNVCTTTGTGTYIVKSVYSKWDDATVDVFGTDTIRVSQNTTLPPLTETIVAAPCGTSTTGSFTITSPVGPSVKYTIVNGSSTTIQYSTTFTGAPGIYTVTAKDTLTGCTGVKTITITTNSTLTATATTVQAGCVGSSSGKITVNASLGGGTYQYSLDGGALQSSNVFNNVIAGSHTISVVDNLGCIFNFTVIVGAGNGFTGTTSNVRATCPGATNGSISVISLTGTAPYTYTLGTTVQVGNNTFTNLAAGSYTINVVDANGCIKNIVGSVASGTGFVTTATTVNASCAGSASGKITVIPPTTNATGPFKYMIDTSATSNTFQNSNIFTNIAGGSYNVTVQDAIGCTYRFPVTVANSAGASATARITNAACAGTATGRIVFIPLAGIRPFIYSIDSGRTFFAQDTFRNIASGIYRLAVRDSNNCLYRFTVSVGNAAGATATATTVSASCSGSGRIIFTPVLGTRPFTYSIDSGRTYQALDTFKNVSGGSYFLAAKDSNGCIYRFTTTVAQHLQQQLALMLLVQEVLLVKLFLPLALE